MTPAQQVALDAMRSAWSEETVRAMEAALTGGVWLVETHASYEGETFLAACWTEESARSYANGWHHERSGDLAEDLNFAASNTNGLHFRAFSGSVELWLTWVEVVPLAWRHPVRLGPAPSLTSPAEQEHFER